MSCQWVSKGREGRTEICSNLPLWCLHTSVRGTLCGVLLTPLRNVSDSWWVALWTSSYSTTVRELSGTAAAHGADAALGAWACNPHLCKGSDTHLNQSLWTQSVQQHSVAVRHPPPFAVPAYAGATSRGWDGCIPFVFGDRWHTVVKDCLELCPRHPAGVQIWV